MKMVGYFGQDVSGFLLYYVTLLLDRRQANLCFHFAGSGENLQDITKSRDASMDNKEFSSLLQILIKQNGFLVLSHKLPFFS